MVLVLERSAKVDLVRSDVKFGDADVLGAIHAGAPIRMLGQMILRPGMKVLLAHRDATHESMPVLQQFIGETRRYLDVLLFGLASPDEADGAPRSPIDVGGSSE